MLDDRLRARLPAAVYNLAIRLGASAKRTPAMVRLSQTDRMRQDRPSRWMTSKAQQTIATGRCSFEWRARTGPGGLVSVRDALSYGVGELDAKALFFSIAHSSASLDLTRGELMRYLAELAWAPDAIFQNPELRWRETGSDTLVVSAGVSETLVEVTLTLNGEGQIGRAFAPDRPRAVGTSFSPTPWQGVFSQYRLHNQTWLPFAGEVAWIVDGKNEVCWEGQIRNWQVHYETHSS
jgi:hypothetical protein